MVKILWLYVLQGVAGCSSVLQRCIVWQRCNVATSAARNDATSLCEHLCAENGEKKRERARESGRERESARDSEMWRELERMRVCGRERERGRQRNVDI